MDAEQLYRDHAAALFRYLQRLTGDADQAADALQETFVRLVERPPRNANPRGWLFRVATHVVYDDQRRRRRRLRLLDEAPDHATSGDPPHTPDSELEGARRRDDVRRALDELDERDRTVLLLRAEGFKQREIAAIIGANTKAMGIIMRRALKKLTHHLPEGGVRT